MFVFIGFFKIVLFIIIKSLKTLKIENRNLASLQAKVIFFKAFLAFWFEVWELINKDEFWRNFMKYSLITIFL